MAEYNVQLSVVIAALDAEQDLPKQLASLGAQNLDVEWEVVVADNGSTDRTVDVVRNGSYGISKLRVVDASDRPGQPHALNRGIAESVGEYIVLLDADDEVTPGYLAAMVEALHTHEFVAARVDCDTLNPEWVRSSRPPAQNDPIARPWGFLPFAAGCSLGLRRSLIEALGGFDPSMSPAHDIDLGWRYALGGGSIKSVDSAVVKYRYRTDLAGIYRQARGYGRSVPMLYRRYRAAGMRRRSLKSTCRYWLGPLRRLRRIHRREGRAELAFLVGFRAGVLQGCWRARVLYL